MCHFSQETVLNARSLRATRVLICPSTPKTGVNRALKRARSLTPFGMTNRKKEKKDMSLEITARSTTQKASEWP